MDDYHDYSFSYVITGGYKGSDYLTNDISEAYLEMFKRIKLTKPHSNAIITIYFQKVVIKDGMYHADDKPEIIHRVQLI